MKKYLPPLLLCLLSLFLTFHALGNETLHPWDEAWYGTIAKNILKTGDLLNLEFNGSHYWDHPPLGFYSIALSYKLFGITEFATRLPMALFATAAIVALYYTGKELFNSVTGFSASLILLSSRWFLIRARSGNLEMPLLFFQILSFFFLYRRKSATDIYLSWFFFSLSLLSKSAISLTLLPLLLISTYMFIRKLKPKLRLRLLLFTFTITLLPLLPWYGFNTLQFGSGFLKQNILKIGFRSNSSSKITLETTNRTLLYLHSSIHHWYTPLLLSLTISLIAFLSRPARWTLGYLTLSAFPYFVSTTTEIWHLLPVIPPTALLIALIPQLVLNLIAKSKLIRHLSLNLGFFHALIPLAIAVISVNSINAYWIEFLNPLPTVTHEARLAIESRKYPYPLVLQDITYMPTVIFYADQNVQVTQTASIIQQISHPFQLIAQSYQLLDYTDFEVVAKSGDTNLAIFK